MVLVLMNAQPVAADAFAARMALHDEPAAGAVGGDGGGGAVAAAGRSRSSAVNAKVRSSGRSARTAQAAPRTTAPSAIHAVGGRAARGVQPCRGRTFRPSRRRETGTAETGG